MRLRLPTTLLGIGVFLLLGSAGAAWYVLAPPPVQNLALAPELVGLDSAEGQRLLAVSHSKADFGQLAPHIVGQARRAFCGPATSAAVVNAARHQEPPVTQTTVFNRAATASKSALAVSLSGLTLEELASMLRAQLMQVTVVHADASDLVTFREVVRTAVTESKSFLVVNYDRRVLRQEGAGHISPVGAYEAATDRVLVLDVATQKYPFTWIPLPLLWAALNTTDPDSGEKRGYILASSP